MFRQILFCGPYHIQMLPLSCPVDGQVTSIHTDCCMGTALSGKGCCHSGSTCPVPQACVIPDPLSHTRMRMFSFVQCRANSTFTRSGESGWRSSTGPTSARATSSILSTKITRWGFPIDTALLSGRDKHRPNPHQWISAEFPYPPEQTLPFPPSPANAVPWYRKAYQQNIRLRSQSIFIQILPYSDWHFRTSWPQNRPR